MDEDLIMIIEKNLNDYRMQMFKAGKNLGGKADITRRYAIGLIKIIGDTQKESTKKIIEKKVIIDFLEMNNWLSLENEGNAKGIVDCYLKNK